MNLKAMAVQYSRKRILRHIRNLLIRGLINYQMTIKPQTVDVIKSYLDTHILPTFGGYGIRKNNCGCYPKLGE